MTILMCRNVLIVAPCRTPYVASREQSPSFEALSSVRLERSDGSLRTGPGWRPHRKLGAAGLRKDCQAGGGYRKPEVGRTELKVRRRDASPSWLRVGRSTGRWRTVP